MNKIWHPCAGYETHYEVSNLGNVRSVERMVLYEEGGFGAITNTNFSNSSAFLVAGTYRTT